MSGPVPIVTQDHGGTADALDLFAAHRRARCPLLVVSGGAPAFAAVFPDRLVPAWEAYCAWTRRELGAPGTVLRLLTGHLSHPAAPARVRLGGGTVRGV